MEKNNQILLTKEAKKDLDNQNIQVVKKVKTALNRIQQNPTLGKILTGKLKPVRSYRFGTPQGEFRVCYLLEDEFILVLIVGHRKDVYKNLAKRS